MKLIITRELNSNLTIHKFTFNIRHETLTFSNKLANTPVMGQHQNVFYSGLRKKSVKRQRVHKITRRVTRGKRCKYSRVAEIEKTSNPLSRAGNSTTNQAPRRQRFKGRTSAGVRRTLSNHDPSRNSLPPVGGGVSRTRKQVYDTPDVPLRRNSN